MKPRYQPFCRLLPLACLLGAMSGNVAAMTEIAEQDLAEMTGEGIAIALEDFRFQMAPTSYIWQVGQAIPAGTTTFRRGDLRWYGLTMSATGATGSGLNGEACNGGIFCPVGPNTGFRLAAFDDPYLLRVFDYTALNHVGTSVSNTVLELLGPALPPAFRWSFWGENIVSPQTCSDGPPTSACFGSGGTLATQTIIHGTPSAPNQLGTDEKGPELLVFRNVDTRTAAAGGDSTFGLIYHSRLKGDFRFSASRTGTSAEGVPLFDNGASDATAPGLKFRNVLAYLPLGQKHYQTIRLDDTIPGRNTASIGNGNFVIELTRLPDNATVYADFYSYAPAATCAGVYAGVDCGYYRGAARPARYYETHGYVRWGAVGTGTAETSTTDGIMFTRASTDTFTIAASTNDRNIEGGTNIASYSVAAQTHINLGTARVDGFLLQGLKITSLGAAP